MGTYGLGYQPMAHQMVAHPTEPRYMPVTKRDKIAFRDQYQDWWFAMHTTDGSTDYGWLPKNVLTKCKKMEGTP